MSGGAGSGPSDVARVQGLFAAACFGDDETARLLTSDLEGLVARHALAVDDAAALLASPRRLGLYRRLVRHNVVNVVSVMLERTEARFEANKPGAFRASVDAFLAQEGPKTPHLRDVPGEFLAWASPRWRNDGSVPAYLADYAEFELAEFTVGVLPRAESPPPLTEVAPDRPLVFADPRRVLHLGWAVHEIAAEDAAAAPEARPVHLLVYRDAEHHTRFLDLTDAASAILERLFEGLPLARAIVEACAATGLPVDQTVLAGAARLLADLGERGVLLGARA